MLQRGLEEFLPHECDLAVPTFQALEHLLPVELEGVVVDGAARLEPHPLKGLPGKSSGCLGFDPAEPKTACNFYQSLIFY